MRKNKGLGRKKVNSIHGFCVLWQIYRDARCAALIEIKSRSHACDARLPCHHCPVPLAAIRDLVAVGRLDLFLGMTICGKYRMYRSVVL